MARSTVAVAALVAVTRAASAPAGQVTWFAASDTHFGHDADNVTAYTKNYNAILEMNRLGGASGACTVNCSWPDALGGGAVQPPLGVTVSGDLIDGGVNGANDYDGCAQWSNFSALYGLDGTDGVLKFRVYEGRGNHDGPNSTMAPPRGCALSSSQHVVARNKLRMADPGFGMTGVSNFTQLHYSWSWPISATCKLHFVHMNLFPGHDCGSADEPEGEGGTPAKPLFPCKDGNLGYAERSMDFLQADLAAHAGPGTLVVTLQHYAFDSFSNGWYNPGQRKQMWSILSRYNALAVMGGHTHTAALYSFNATGEVQGDWASGAPGFLDVVVAPATQKEGPNNEPLPSEFMVLQAALDDPADPKNRTGTLRVAQRVGSGWGAVLGSKRFTC